MQKGLHYGAPKRPNDILWNSTLALVPARAAFPDAIEIDGARHPKPSAMPLISTRNGLAILVFDDTRVSNLRVQITQRDDRMGARLGPYPYSRHIRHGVFSVTKSLEAAVALLRLAAKYGDGVFDSRIGFTSKAPITN